ncbi:MAG: amidohydrolase [Candidatus Aminicenantes bacterium]|nr:MAG: amidohydrolase [Candidatus Aminicenantes bacterium]
MNKKFVLGLYVLLVFCSFSLQCKKQEKADMALLNGKVFTEVSGNVFVEAAAIKDGKILSLGTTNEIKEFIDSSTHILDMEGKLVLPGFIDAHCHFASGGRSLTTLTFRGVNSVEKIQKMVATKVKELPEGAPIFGSQFDHTLFPGGKWPTKEDLDKVSLDNPVVIRRVDGHSVWINGLALRQSGITRRTKDPFGGEIIRNPTTSEPTGILKEAATRMVKVKGPRIQSTLEQDIERAMNHAVQLGLTGVHTSSSLEEIEIYKKLDEEGRLTLRIYAWLPIKKIDEYIEKGIKRGQGNDMVKVGFLKVYIDGTISSATALMFEPFSDEPSKSGLAQYEEEEFYALVEKAHRNGYQVGIHAIGDKGIHWALNAIEQAQRKHGKKGLRHRIEHSSIIHPQDIKRFHELGVIASMQPTHCTTDLSYCERRFGRERSERVYIWKTLLENRAVLAFGTDWAVEPLDPMRGLYSCVTRKSIEFDYPEEGWFAEQRLSIAEAIRYYTLGSAYASFEEDIKGSLREGTLADMVVLSKDLFTAETKEILTVQVLYTILGGKIVYQRQSPR